MQKIIETGAPAVLVTGVGAVIGYGIIKALRMSTLPSRVIGVDVNPNAVGFRFVDKSFVCPRASSGDYIGFLADLCRKEKISLVIPGIEQDIEALIKRRAELEDASGAKIVLNSPGVYEIARDKWKTYCFLKESGIPSPQTFLVTDAADMATKLNPPFLLKPRAGQAGKGIVTINSAEDLSYWCAKVSWYIAQEIIGTDDEEYTAAVFGKGNGSFEGPIIMRRRMNYGTTFEACVDEFPLIREVVAETARRLKPIGPTNVQLRMDGGVPKVLEINPRMSSSVSLKAAFGFNEAEMSIRFFLMGQTELSCRIKKGFAQRYIEDMVFQEN